MKKYLIIFAIFFILNNVYSQYVSPGLRIGYDFNSNVTFGLKLSAGIYKNGNFYNITFGKKFTLNHESEYQKHNYIDFQFGKLSEPMGDRKIQLFYGAGLGVVFYNENSVRHYFPRISTFAGNLVFTTLDFNITDFKKIEPDLGLQIVFPIPFGEKPNFGTGG